MKTTNTSFPVSFLIRSQTNLWVQERKKLNHCTAFVNQMTEEKHVSRRKKRISSGRTWKKKNKQMDEWTVTWLNISVHKNMSSDIVHDAVLLSILVTYNLRVHCAWCNDGMLKIPVRTNCALHNIK